MSTQNQIDSEKKYIEISKIGMKYDEKYAFEIYERMANLINLMMNKINELEQKLSTTEKELNELKIMIEYSPDNKEKMDELKEDFYKLANE